MTMRLTLTLPASTAELRGYVDALDALGLGQFRHDDEIGMLVASPTTVAVADPPPAYVPHATEVTTGAPALAKTPKVNKRAAKKATTAKAKPRKVGPPSPTTGAILDHLEDIGGRFDGSGTDLAAKLGLDQKNTAQVITRLAATGKVILTKPHPRKITAITLTSARYPEDAEPKATPAPRPTEQLKAEANMLPRPTPAPAAGIPVPAGGWR